MRRTSAEQSKHYRDKAFNKRMMVNLIRMPAWPSLFCCGFQDIRRGKAELAEMTREGSLTPNLDRIRKSNRLKEFALPIAFLDAWGSNHTSLVAGAGPALRIGPEGSQNCRGSR